MQKVRRDTDRINGPLSVPNQLIPKDHPLVTGALARRDVFDNRAAVEKYMSSRPYFTAWDEQVRALHVRYGFYPLPGNESKGVAEQPVTLRMTKWSEAYTFALSFQGSWASMQLLNNLPAMESQWKLASSHGRPTFLHCIFSRYFTEQLDMLIETRNRFTRAFEGASEHYTAQDIAANHLVVMEDPRGSGVLLADALSSHLSKAAAKKALHRRRTNSRL